MFFAEIIYKDHFPRTGCEIYSDCREGTARSPESAVHEANLPPRIQSKASQAPRRESGRRGGSGTADPEGAMGWGGLSVLGIRCLTRQGCLPGCSQLRTSEFQNLTCSRAGRNSRKIHFSYPGETIN